MKEQRIMDEIEKTLNSLELIPKHDANPFLYTRLKARIEAESLKQTKHREFLSILKPVALGLILIVNIITALYFFDANANNQSSSSLINLLSQEYQTNQTQLENYNLE
jgi:hypothetical protein